MSFAAEAILQDLISHGHFWHLRKRSLLISLIFFRGASTRTIPEFPFVMDTSGIILDHVLTHKIQLEDYRKRLWQMVTSDPQILLKIMSEAYKKHEQDLSNGVPSKRRI